MKFIDLTPEQVNSRVGKLLPASYGAYPTFVPNDLPIKIKYSEELTKLVSEAILSIGNLDGISRHFNPRLLINTYLRKEAVLSSKIEGTRTSLSEVLIEEQQKGEVKEHDIKEVLNYVRALEWSINMVETEPISEELIKEAHRILLRGVRGEDKEPGIYKRQQNWIGPSYDPSEAEFIPCSPSEVHRLMENFTKYMDIDDSCPPLIKAGAMHYQFEAIHPFRDGNGRIGRMLIMLFLIKKGILHDPLLYLSAFFEKYQEDYNQKLYNVSIEGDLENWLKFFLKGVKIQSDDALKRAKELEKYYCECKELLQEKSDSNTVFAVLDIVFRNLYITIPRVAKKLNAHYPKAKYNVEILIKNGILKQLNVEKKKNKIFFSPKIQEILERKEM